MTTSLHLTYLFLGLGLGDEVASDLDPGLEEGFGHLGDGKAQKMCYLLSYRVVRERRLVIVTLLLELHATEQHHRAHDAEYC